MDFETARFNMIEQQIRPWDVLDQDVLDSLAALRREEFVPPDYRALAFTDMEIPLHIAGAHTGEVMLAPKVEARLLQALAPRKHEYGLEIGAGSGYMAALLARHAREVLTLELHPTLAEFAQANLARSGIGGVRVENADATRAASVNGSDWDVICFSGSVPQLGNEWLERLKIGGRLVAIVGEAPVMRAQLVTRLGPKSFDTKILFETVVRPLLGFPAKSRFVF